MRYLNLSVATMAIYICIVFLGCDSKQDYHQKAVLEEEAFASQEKMSPEEFKKFQTSLNKISVGDSYDQVVSVLGKPSSDTIGMRKERPEFIVRMVDYIVEQKDSRWLNSKTDRYVDLYFDKENILEKIIKNNIE